MTKKSKTTIVLASETMNKNIMTILTIAIPLVLTNCAHQRTIDVDISAGRLTLYKGVVPIMTTPVQTAAKGVGFKINSKQTPTGSYTITKDPDHRFGEVLRLSGYQGNNRGILVHKHFGILNGTNGCICPHTEAAMKKLFRRVKDGDRIVIRR